jgi:ubiquinone/menaquinone biosynthesis C-methylase UbiE
MNDDRLAVIEEFELGIALQDDEYPERQTCSTLGIPDYLEETYWWAYLRPGSIWLFEREWLVNMILFGNMKRLTQSVMDELDLPVDGDVLQVACVYGDFSNRLARHLESSNAQLHILDVAAIQLQNTRKKIAHHKHVKLHQQDSSAVHFKACRFENTVVFFLLHEQPEDVRRKTIAEAIRVTRPGGKVIFIDYHRPKRTNPLRYLMIPVLKWLEPFALDLWRTELPDYLPEGIDPEQISSQFYCGGLYQKVVINC